MLKKKKKTPRRCVCYCILRLTFSLGKLFIKQIRNSVDRLGNSNTCNVNYNINNVLLKLQRVFLLCRQPPAEETWNGQIIGYKVSYVDVNEIAEVYTKTILGLKRCEVRITNLKPFTTYRIAVRAFNSIGPGPESDFVRVTTNEGGKTNRSRSYY